MISRSRKLKRKVLRVLLTKPVGVVLAVLAVVVTLIAGEMYRLAADDVGAIRKELATLRESSDLFSQDGLVMRVPVTAQFTFRLKEDASASMHRHMRVTTYSNRKAETDDTPNRGACDMVVFEGSAAVSQDLFRKKFRCGDVVCVVKTRRCYVVQDTMNARFKNSLDIFMDKGRPAEERNVMYHSDVVGLHN